MRSHLPWSSSSNCVLGASSRPLDIKLLQAFYLAAPRWARNRRRIRCGCPAETPPEKSADGKIRPSRARTHQPNERWGVDHHPINHGVASPGIAQVAGDADEGSNGDALARLRRHPRHLGRTFHLQANTAKKFNTDLKAVFAQRDADLFGAIKAALQDFCARNKSVSRGSFVRAVRTLATRTAYDADGLVETALAIYDDASHEVPKGKGQKRQRTDVVDDGRGAPITRSYDSTMATFAMETAAAELSFGMSPGGVF